MKETGHGADKLRLSVPLDSRYSEDLSRANVKRDSSQDRYVFNGGKPQVLHGNKGSAAVPVVCKATKVYLPTNHEPRYIVPRQAVRSARIDDGRIPHNRHVFGNAHYLVQLV